MSFNDSGDWSFPTTVCPSDLHAPLPSGHPYDSLVPPSTTLAPGDLLRSHYRNRRAFDQCADPNVLRIQMEVHQNHPENAALPIGSTGLIGKWKRPNGLPAELVPVHGVEPILDRSQAVIEFRDRDQEGPSSGVRMLHFYQGSADPERLQDADDFIMFDEMSDSQVDFIIAWPGYGSLRFDFYLSMRDGGPLTRFELGKQIALMYAHHFGLVEKGKILPSEAGFYNIALHQGENCRWDSLGIQLSQLHLVRLRNTKSGSWVADIEIV